MTETLRDELRTLVAHYGLSIIQQPRRCKAYLMDCCGKQRREILALITAQEEQIVQRILTAPDSIPQALLIAQLTAQLVNSHPLDPAIARWAVETWVYVVTSIPDIRAIRPPKDALDDAPPTEPPPPPAKLTPTPPPAQTPPISQGARPPTVASRNSAATPTVVAPPKPALPTFTVPALDLDFGAVAHWTQAAPQEIRLTNPSTTQTLYGAARSTLPWLAVTPNGFSCLPKQAVVLTVTVTAALTRLSPKSYTVADAIVIENGAQHQHIGVRIDLGSMRMSTNTPTLTSWIQEPEPPSAWPTPSAMQPTPPSQPPPTPATTPADVAAPAPLPALTFQVDFGVVSRQTDPLPSREVRLPNPRTDREMTGTARSTLPWLAVAPGGFVCRPGAEVRLSLQLTKAASHLRPKTYNVPDAVIIETDGTTYQISARLTVAPRE